MTFGARARVVNPRLGTYFSIFAALFTALFLLVLIFEQLNLNESLLRLAFFAGGLRIGFNAASRPPSGTFAKDAGAGTTS